MIAGARQAVGAVGGIYLGGLGDSFHTADISRAIAERRQSLQGLYAQLRRKQADLTSAKSATKQANLRTDIAALQVRISALEGELRQMDPGLPVLPVVTVLGSLVAVGVLIFGWRRSPA